MLSSFNWVFLALLAAFIESFKDLCSKSSLHSVSPQLAGLVASAVPIPLLVGFLILTKPWPTIEPGYFLALAVGGSLNVLGMFQFMRALQASDLSLTIPFISFTPIFLLVTSPLLVGDVPTGQDVFGILCIVAGAYILHLHTIHKGIFWPFQAIWSHPGPRRMLSVALIYSLTSNFDKLGVQHSSPLLWSVSITTVMAIGFLLLFRFTPQAPQTFPRGGSLGILLMIGVFQGLVLLVQNHAILSGPVPSVIALKRSSIFFAVAWGLLLLREPQGRERLWGSLLMVTGIAVLGFGQNA